MSKSTSKAASLSNIFIYTPKCCLDYFDEKKRITVENRGTFQIYLKGTSGIYILVLHSFGSCGVTWANFTEEMYSTINCQIISIDFRDHGNSDTIKPRNLSLKILAEDVHKVLTKHFSSKIPKMHIMGHSTGGSVGLKLAEMMPIESIAIVDGTEKDCINFLPELEKLMNSRKQTYDNLEDAIFDYVNNGYSSDFSSARAVVPVLMHNLATNKNGGEDACYLESTNHKSTESLAIDMKPVRPSMMKTTSQIFKGKYVWRAHFKHCQKFYREWYNGYTTRLLAYTGPKLLLISQPFELDPKIENAVSKNQLECHELKRKALLVHEGDVEEIVEIYKNFMLKHNFITLDALHKL